MNDRLSYILSRLIGPDDPQVKALLWSERDPKMRELVPGMFRNLAMQHGIDPDNPPAFGHPRGISRSDWPLGRSKCGDIPGEEVGPSRDDVNAGGGIGVFGISGVGKTTLIKMFMLSFTGKMK